MSTPSTQDLPGVRRVEARQQVRERRLAAAGGADERDGLARRDAEARRPRAPAARRGVGEAHVPELDLAARASDLDRAAIDLGLLVDQLEHRLGRGEAALHRLVHVGEALQRRHQHEAAPRGRTRTRRPSSGRAAPAGSRSRRSPRPRTSATRCVSRHVRRRGGRRSSSGSGAPCPRPARTARLSYSWPPKTFTTRWQPIDSSSTWLRSPIAGLLGAAHRAQAVGEVADDPARSAARRSARAA